MTAGTLAYMAPAQTGRMKWTIAVGLGGKSDKKRCAQIWRDALRFFVDGDDHFGAAAGYEIASGGSPE